MTDVFRSEILAVVMQQIVDEPVLPVLFLRTVSPFYHRKLAQGAHGIKTGHPSGQHIQIPCGLRIDNPAISPHHEEDLDEPSLMGGIHSLR